MPESPKNFGVLREACEGNSIERQVNYGLGFHCEIALTVSLVTSRAPEFL